MTPSPPSLTHNTLNPTPPPTNRFVHRRQSATAAGVHPTHIDKAVKLGLVLPGPDGPLDRSAGGVSGGGRLLTATSTTSTTTTTSIASALFGSVDLTQVGYLDRARVDSFSSEEAGSSDGEGEHR